MSVTIIKYEFFTKGIQKLPKFLVTIEENISSTKEIGGVMVVINFN